MRNFITGLIIGLSIVSIAYAKKISQPIPSNTQSVEEQNFDREIYDNWGLLEVVTENPDGTRKGRLGEVVIYNLTGTYYLEICVSSPNGTVWVGKQLEDIP
jgi:hypothetical protein